MTDLPIQTIIRIVEALDLGLGAGEIAHFLGLAVETVLAVRDADTDVMLRAAA